MDYTPQHETCVIDGAARCPAPFTLVIFGASGDLTARKLVPALFNLHREGRLPEVFQIVGFARREKTDDEFRREMKEGSAQFSRFSSVEGSEWQDFAQHLHYHVGEFPDTEAYRRLSVRLQELPNHEQIGGRYLFYLATAPEFFSVVAANLKEAGLLPDADLQQLVVEKPFGTDAASAAKLNASLQSSVAERALYRIDHYLGKETVQNLLYLRFANSIFEPMWNRRYIDNVQITVSEAEGVGTRGGYYDQSGALRDMVQNHMMQLLTLTAMEPPASLDAESLRDEKVKVLRSIPSFDTTSLSDRIVRAQYEGYTTKPKVAADSKTETFIAAELHIENWRWSGVPFYLRTGKGMARRSSEITIVFRRPPSVLFQAKCGQHLARNYIAIRLQPNEGVHVRFNAKTPGRAVLQPVDMDFAYKSEFGSYSPEAYERLLHDALLQDSTLFTRDDEVREAWRIVDSIQKQWSMLPMHSYSLGSWGPRASAELLKRHGCRWLAEDPRFGQV